VEADLPSFELVETIRENPWTARERGVSLHVMMGPDVVPAGLRANRAFATTHWSLVLRAGGAGDPSKADEALACLCQIYWYPVYAFFRSEGRAADQCEDLTQAFFTDLLRRKDLVRVHPAKGRFRSFLLAAARNFLLNERDRARRLKRGGGAEIISIDGLEAERWYQIEPVDGASPDKLFDRRWAETLIERGLSRLKADYQAAGCGARFEVLREFVLGESVGVSYAEAADRLGLSESAVTSAIHRMRVRFRELFRQEVSETVEHPAEVETEIRELLEALSQ
jgi:RNA polymerase sigma-70 factor (ECF subfamily)